MSYTRVPKLLAALFAVLMVTSMVGPAAAATSSSTASAQTSPSGSFDFSGSSDDQMTNEQEAMPSPDVQPDTDSPYDKADLAELNISLGETLSNGDGTITVPVRVNGTYDEGRYPWRVPVTVEISSDDVSESAVVILAPGQENDYNATTEFTLQFVQDGTTNHTVMATAQSQENTSNTARADHTYTVEGESSERDVTTSGEIRNRDLYELPTEVTGVTRYRATERASGYLEDAGIPAGRGSSSSVENFTNARDSNGKYAVFSSESGNMNIGTLTTGVVQGSAQTLVIRYQPLSGDNVDVTPVHSDGNSTVGTSYTLASNSNLNDNEYCHDDPDNPANVCIFRLSDVQTSHVNSNQDLILRYETDTSADVAMFCQDVVTGAMPDERTVCGLDDVNSYGDGRIVGMDAENRGNVASEGETLHVVNSEPLNINVSIRNMGDEDVNGTVELASTDEANFSTLSKNVTLAGGQSETIEFTDLPNIQRDYVSFVARFDGSREVIHAKRNDEDGEPTASGGGPYVVPLETVGNPDRVLIGSQRQTLTEKPGPQWERIGEVGVAGGTDNWTTDAKEVPVIGDMENLTKVDNNLSYLSSLLDQRHGSATVSQAYESQIAEAKNQLPQNADPDNWGLADINFTSHLRTDTTVNTTRPPGYGWEKVDTYGETATGEYETEWFRIRPADQTADGIDITPDTDGEGWIRTDAEPKKELVGYDYNNSTTKPGEERNWTKHQYVGTKQVELNSTETESMLKDEREDPGPAWTYTGEVGDQHRYVKQYRIEDVWTWRAPIHDYYFKYKRPLTEPAYEWERQVYDAEFIFERTAAGPMYEWEGPEYAYQSNYEESETIDLDGSGSFDHPFPLESSGLDQFEWTFENGSTEQGETVTAEYSQPFGTYNPELKVWDNDGNTDIDNETDVIVKPASRFCEEDNTCEPYSAVPDLTINDTNNPVDYHTQDIWVNANISGHIQGEEWTVTVTSPDSSYGYEKEVWRSHSIINQDEQFNANVDPQEAGLSPGYATIELVATPASAEEPRITESVEVFLCDPNSKVDGYYDNDCDEMDPDGDGASNGEENCQNNPLCEYSKTDEEFYEVSSEMSWTWDTTEDWRDAQNHKFVQVDDTDGSARLVMGYAKNETWQRERFDDPSTDDTLTAWFDFNRPEIPETLPSSPTAYNEAWSVEDSSWNDNHGMAFVANDTNPYSRATERYAPDFGVEGMHGSNGVSFYSPRAYINFLADCSDEQRGSLAYNGVDFPCKGQSTLDESITHEDGYTISWWASDHMDPNLDTEGAPDTEFSMTDGENTFTYHHTWRCDEIREDCGASKWDDDTQWGQQFWFVSQRLDGFMYFPHPQHHTTNYPTMNTSLEPTLNEWTHYTYTVEPDDDQMYTTTSLYKNGELKMQEQESGIPTNVDNFVWGGFWDDASKDFSFGDDAVIDDLRIASGTPSNETEVQDRYFHGGEGTLVTEPRAPDNQENISSENLSEGVNVTDMKINFQGQLQEHTNLTVTVFAHTSDGDVAGVSEPVEYNKSSDLLQNVTFTDEVDNASNFSMNVTLDNTYDRPGDAYENDPWWDFREGKVDGDATPRVDLLELMVPSENGTLSTPPRAALEMHGSEYELTMVGDQSYDTHNGNITDYEYRLYRGTGSDRTHIATKMGNVDTGNEIPEYHFDGLKPGTYSGKLIVTDNDDDTHTATATETVEEGNLDARMLSSHNSPSPGQRVSFLGNESGGDIQSYEWTINGEWVDNGETMSTEFDSQGDYDVTLTVENSDGVTNSETKTITVVDRPPLAEAGPDKTRGGTQLVFDGSGSFDREGDIVKYEWDFDSDGNYDYESSDPTVMAHNGEYGDMATLRVTDEAGQTSTDTLEISYLRG